MTQKLYKIAEVEAGVHGGIIRRLGRHVEHDERSKEFVVEQASMGVPRDIYHIRMVPPFDQGSLGSCTGNGMAGLLMSSPFFNPWTGTVTLNEQGAIELYQKATELDEFDGTFPPDDTGSSGLGVARAAKYFKLIASYRHAFGITQALNALALKPVITGVNWYDSFDSPDSNGLVEISPNAQVRGGHEFEILGVDYKDQLVRAANSWGEGWGDNGYFQFSFETWDRLLVEDGDVMTISR